MTEIAKRLSLFEESKTLRMAKLSRELASQGIDVINLTLGEPDFATPTFIKEAAKQAIDDNFSYYTPVPGYLDLREAICRKFKRDNQLDFTPDQIVVSTGAKHAIMNVVMSLVDPGDEVIIPTPYWVSYSEMVKLAEGVIRFVHSGIEKDYKVSAADIAPFLNEKSKLLIFSSPCNPSGSSYTYEELKAWADLFEKYPRLHIISDEIYEHINFQGPHISLASFSSIKDRVITVNGVSKGFAMTGWRIGYIAANAQIAKACEKIQGQFTSGTSSISQRAAIAAIEGPLDASKAMKATYLKRRDIVYDALNEIPGMKTNLPGGAFYLFPDVHAFFGKRFENTLIQNAEDLCMYILHHAHVSVVSGDAFGAPNCIRISYATAEEKLIEAMRRMKVALQKLHS